MDARNRNQDIDNLKKQIDALQPLPAHTMQQLKEYFRIGLTYSSNALEGNTLTETETKVILEDGLTIGGKTLREHLEVIGHSCAYDFMLDCVTTKTITQETICQLHRLFYQSIDLLNAGSYRTEQIIVTGTDFAFPMPDQIAHRMHKFVDQIETLRVTEHPVFFAALLHLHFVMIHPFIDGNGRTARLLMNLALLQHGYVITIIPPVLRSDYIAALRKSNDGNNEPFKYFISEMVYESHKEYLRLIKR